MRQSLLILFSCLTLSAIAETLPDNYYTTADCRKDSALKSELSLIIRNGERYKYGSRSDQSTHLYTWDGFFFTDRRANGTIWDMYSPYRHYFTYNNRSASGMAIEHSFPKSWWGGDNNDAYKDLYHLNPSEHRANTAKSDYAPGLVDSLVTFDNGIFRTGYGKGHPTFRVWEPADEYKGDFARAYFYIATCYEDFHWIDTIKLTTAGNPSLASTSGAYFAMDNTNWQEFQPWLRDILLQWHRNDPVSEKEIRRQDAVSSIQHNRNPYIDYPELVEYIWGDKQGIAVNFNLLTLTCSNSYDCPIDTTNIEAYAATDVNDHGFSAQWKDAGTDHYTLDIYSKEIAGHNDTLICMHAVRSALIAQTEHVSWSGSSYTSDGDCAMLLGTASADYEITISGIDIPAQTRLVIRANISKYDTEAWLSITADETELENIPLTFNETYYTVDIPAGTQNIVLRNGKKGKRVSVQNIFLICGNRQLITHHLNGFPSLVAGTSCSIETTLHTNTPLYYCIAPDQLPQSNEICVSYTPTTLPAASAASFSISGNATTLTINNLTGLSSVTIYDARGRILYNIHTSETHCSFRLPQPGIYLVQVNGTTCKVKL